MTRHPNRVQHNLGNRTVCHGGMPPGVPPGDSDQDSPRTQRMESKESQNGSSGRQDGKKCKGGQTTSPRDMGTIIRHKQKENGINLYAFFMGARLAHLLQGKFVIHVRKGTV